MSTIRSFGRPAFYGALLLTLSSIAGCKGKASSKGKAEDGGLSDASQAAGKDGGASSKANLLKAPEAKQVGMLTLDEPVSDVVHVADLALSLHSTSGVSLLDMSDPSSPKVISRLPTTGRAVGVAYDVELRILFIITVSGDLRAYRVGDVTMPVQVSQSTISEPGATGDTITGFVRIGMRLFVLGQSHLLPVSVLYGASGSVGFLALDAVQLDADPQLISSGGDSLYIAFKGGGVQVFSSGDAPAMTDKASLGANVVGWVVRGSRLFVVLEGRGLRVIDMTVKGKLSVLFDAPDFNDATALKRFGNLVLIALSRGLLVALDLTALDAPRALVTRSGSLPDWISAVSGNLLLGSGKQLQVFGIPPFVSATVPKVLRGGFPRYGRIPIQLSKPVDPTTVTVANVKLLCGGTSVEGTVVVSLDGLHITFLPKGDLPAGATCSLNLGGVKDLLGLSLSVPQVAPALTFNTMTQAPAAVDNKKSGYAHTADGQLTDWTAGKTKDFEYFDVTPARGMYSYFYADHDGTRLWMLNDWFYNGDKIDPDCFNQFGVWTGGGTERWDIRAYGDQHIEVRLNGTLLAADDKRVSGGYSHGASPNGAEPHTMYEISVQTAPGAWGVQLHDPGPTYGCDQLETDPTTYNATSTDMGSSIDPTMPPTAPSTPTPSVGQVSIDLGTTLTWSTGDAPGGFASYLIEISTGTDLGNIVYRTWVYGPQLTLPVGLLQSGMTYTFRVTAYNLAGSSQSDPVTFTVGQVNAIGAPGIDSVQPTSVTQGQATAFSITGTGFVQGAQAFFNGVALNTTFVSSTSLTAMLDAADNTGTGTFALTVRNVPGDDATQSNAIKIAVQAPQVAACAHAECIPGDRLDGACSSCATDVCASHANCCQDSWDPACANAAAASQVCGCSVPSLETVSTNAFPASTDTSVTATLVNAPVGGSYELVYAPLSGTDGGVGASFTCAATEANTCTATVNLTAGSYAVHLRVGTGTPIDASPLPAAITVSAATACAHDECAQGASLTSGCSTCATDVCAGLQTCCSGNYGLDCVLRADGMKTCSCTKPALNTGALNVSSQTANDSTPVTVTIANAVVGAAYTLAIMPHATSTETTFQCALNAQATGCDATISGVSATGAYDVLVRISGAVAHFDTNTLMNAFTVNAASACAHSPCLPGPRLASSCDSCVATICANVPTATCCTTGWTSTCVAQAPTLGMCSCTNPALSTLTPNTQTAGATTQVAASLTNAPATASYSLVLTPVGGGNENVFSCAYSMPLNNCTASVSGLTAQGYNALVRITIGGPTDCNGSPCTYDTNVLDTGFTAN